MAVSKRVRFEVLRRDNHACRYCGATAPDAVLTVDHVVPVALGGGDDPSNLVAACRDCNAGKASTKPDERVVGDVSADAIRWAAAMAKAAAVLADREKPRKDYVNAFVDRWRDFGAIPVLSDWRATIEAFYASGLPIDALIDAVDVAMGNRRVSHDHVFRYFCGVCWRKLDELQRIATDLIAAEEADGGA